MKNELIKVLILVKTYPTLSKKYSELVCTAGIKEDGSWVRIYPIPFRIIDGDKKYKKYQWIEAKLTRNQSDPRPESHKISDIDSIKLLDIIDTKNDWEKRRELILEKLTVYQNKEEIIKKAKNNELSLVIFKPKKIIDFIVEDTEREWDKDLVKKIENDIKQPELFDTDEELKAKETFKLVKKIPYKFSYKFLDNQDKESCLMIEDWELGQLYWNCLKNSDNDEKKAIEKVKQKYFDEFTKKDIYLYLGTTRQYHGWAVNPYVIIGVFYPPYKK
jgi:hypothetical protein